MKRSCSSAIGPAVILLGSCGPTNVESNGSFHHAIFQQASRTLEETEFFLSADAAYSRTTRRVCFLPIENCNQHTPSCEAQERVNQSSGRSETYDFMYVLAEFGDGTDLVDRVQWASILWRSPDNRRCVEGSDAGFLVRTVSETEHGQPAFIVELMDNPPASNIR